MSPRPYRLGQRQVATEQTRARILAAARELLSAEAGVAGFTIDAVARQAGVARMTVYYQFNSKRGLLEALFDDLANRSLVERLIPALQTPEPLAALRGLVEAFAGFWAAERVVMRRVRSLAALDPEVEEGVRARDERRRGHLQRILARLADTETPPPPLASFASATQGVATAPIASAVAVASNGPDASAGPGGLRGSSCSAATTLAAGSPASAASPSSASASADAALAASAPVEASGRDLDVADVLHTLTSFETFDTLAGVSRPIEAVTPWVLRLAWLALGLPVEASRDEPAGGADSGGGSGV